MRNMEASRLIRQLTLNPTIVRPRRIHRHCGYSRTHRDSGKCLFGIQPRVKLFYVYVPYGTQIGIQVIFTLVCAFGLA